ncbi:sugar O-acetyltransferase [Paenibacillus sp. MZ04-78.2]|uniref:sugar O-acetyltransferase n=1 Tax=Paenibacillus sp. MZ04-78.2 TaxID=2962034 RepID=UPI0020B729B0|nr:sugar O-acetyltransferase [Paenibacillus sp. MZ04-78.2]MCP3773103.1 sugar O-acetyltransferase [Paenibacillus sp. MZ04-78.2]
MNGNNKEKVYYERGTNELREKSLRAQKLVKAFNDCDPEYAQEKERIIRELFGSVGEGASIEHNFHCDLGYNIHVGRNFYAGYNCTIMDMAEVRIGDDCMIAPNVGIYTAGHSIEPKNRNKGGYGIPIAIGNNVWIGGHCSILPRVTIGDNSIVAAGSVVTKDVPANTIVAGNPAKLLRHIAEEQY